MDRSEPAMIRPRRLLASCWAVALVVGTSSAQEGASPSRPTLGTIERFDPRFDQLIAPGARIERLAEGFDWSEGPVWVAKDKALLFSDVPGNTVYKWAEGLSKPEVFLRPSGYTGSAPRGASPAPTA